MRRSLRHGEILSSRSRDRGGRRLGLVRLTASTRARRRQAARERISRRVSLVIRRVRRRPARSRRQSRRSSRALRHSPTSGPRRVATRARVDVATSRHGVRRPNTTPRASRTRVPASRTRCPGSTTRPARNRERGPRAVRGRGVLDRELRRTDHHRVGVLSARAVALPAGASVSGASSRHLARLTKATRNRARARLVRARGASDEQTRGD